MNAKITPATIKILCKIAKIYPDHLVARVVWVMKGGLKNSDLKVKRKKTVLEKFVINHFIQVMSSKSPLKEIPLLEVSPYAQI